MIYTVADIQNKVKHVAERFDIQKVYLFGSYFDGTPTDQSDVDLLVEYGEQCRGLECIHFMNVLEAELGKDVDVINLHFAPAFVKDLDLSAKGRLLYEKKEQK